MNEHKNSLTRRIQNLTDTNGRLRAINAELLAALKEAVKCIEYCRKAHKNAQSNTGFPIEIMWRAAIAKAEQVKP